MSGSSVSAHTAASTPTRRGGGRRRTCSPARRGTGPTARPPWSWGRPRWRSSGVGLDVERVVGELLVRRLLAPHHVVAEAADELDAGDGRRPVVVERRDPAGGRVPEVAVLVGADPLEPLPPAVVAEVLADRGTGRAPSSSPSSRPRTSRAPRGSGWSSGGRGRTRPTPARWPSPARPALPSLPPLARGRTPAGSCRPRPGAPARPAR